MGRKMGQVVNIPFERILDNKLKNLVPNYRKKKTKKFISYFWLDVTNNQVALLRLYKTKRGLCAYAYKPVEETEIKHGVFFLDQAVPTELTDFIKKES